MCGRKCSRLCLMLTIIILIVASVLCHIIALATNYWLTSSDSTKNNFLNIGLFVACFDNYYHRHESPAQQYDGCHGLYDDAYITIRDWLIPSWLVSCRVLAIVSLILQIVGIIFFILLLLWILCQWLCCDRKGDCCEKFLIYATPIIWIVTGMFLMMTLMIFADNAFRLQCKDFWLGGDDPNNNHLSWSWGFEVASCVLTFVTGGFIIWFVVLKARDDL